MNRKNNSHKKSINHRLKALLALALAFLIISQTGCAKKQGEAAFPVYSEGFYLDTICRITIYSLGDAETSGEANADDAEAAQGIIDGAFDVCKEYEGLLSRTVETSDISKINAAGGSSVTCDHRTLTLIKDGICFSKISEGGFNIALGGITELWDFHAMEPKLPDPDELAEALAHVPNLMGKGLEPASAEEADAATGEAVRDGGVVIDGETVSLKDPKTKLDLGGIAKGYIADRIADYLMEQGVSGAVVDLGGNIVVVGHKVENDLPSDIVVGIKKPYTETNELVGTVSLHDASVVTSGVYERYFEIDGVKYHHVLDPSTGYPISSGLESITVVGPLGSSEFCDALATTVLIKGEEWLRTTLDKPYGENPLGFTGRNLELNDFTFILIRDDGSMDTLGSSAYQFTIN